MNNRLSEALSKLEEILNNAGFTITMVEDIHTAEYDNEACQHLDNKIKPGNHTLININVLIPSN